MTDQKTITSIMEDLLKQYIGRNCIIRLYNDQKVQMKINSVRATCHQSNTYPSWEIKAYMSKSKHTPMDSKETIVYKLVLDEMTMQMISNDGKYDHLYHYFNGYLRKIVKVLDETELSRTLYE